MRQHYNVIRLIKGNREIVHTNIDDPNIAVELRDKLLEATPGDYVIELVTIIDLKI